MLVASVSHRFHPSSDSSLLGLFAAPYPAGFPHAGSGHDHHSPYKTYRHNGTGEHLFLLTEEADFILVVQLARQVLFRHIRVFFQRYLSQQPGLQFPILQE